MTDLPAKRTSPVNPGRIDWSGENPGILLKDQEDGPFSAMALFFRIRFSAFGQGHALLLFADPQNPRSLPDVHNVFMSDNERLGDYLIADFIAKLPAFAEAPAFAGMTHVPIKSVRTEGDPNTRYKEIVHAKDMTVEMVWDQLGDPTFLELPPELTGPKDRELTTLLIESREARILVNGRSLPGKPAKRVQAGIETTTAFLYFSETWVIPES